MRDVGPLIALIVFIVLTAVFGFQAFDSYGKLTGSNPKGEKPNEEITEINFRVQKEVTAVEALESDVRKSRADVANLQSQLDRWQARKYFAEYIASGASGKGEGVLELAHRGRQLLVKAAKQSMDQATELKGTLTEAKNQVKSALQKEEAEIRNKTESDISKLQEEKDGSIRRVAAEKLALDRDEKDLNEKKNFQKSALDEAKNQLDKLTSREIEHAEVQNVADGKVVLSDPVNNTVCIDIGTSAGVRNGYCFQVYAQKADGKKLHKAYVVVRKASPNISDCLILTKPIELPKDPLSDYVASQPEELYSPYQESGKTGSMLQQLNAVPKRTTLGMDPMNPIVVGDSIQNPFFAPYKSFTFYIVGDKSVAGLQNNGIVYQWPHVKKVVEFYGGKVVDKVDLGVNYMIAQKVPQNPSVDDPEFAKGVTLGIPVMYEWELFRFLDQ